MEYSKKIIERLTKPKNVGETPDADGVDQMGPENPFYFLVLCLVSPSPISLFS